jgi:hypothetical protein
MLRQVNRDDVRTLHIVPVHAFCAQPICLVYLLMQLGSLEDVSVHVERKGRFGWSQRVAVACGMLRAVHYLHSTTPTKPQIVHRSMPPRAPTYVHLAKGASLPPGSPA